jgi:hypothetical protein
VLVAADRRTHLVEELGDAERMHVLELSTTSAQTNDWSSTS